MPRKALRKAIDWTLNMLAWSLGWWLTLVLAAWWWTR